VTLKEAIQDKNFNNIAIIIGPEGGFSETEIDLLTKHPNVKVVSLGNRILRTETAAIATLAMISYEIEL
jgi:16S rRNA (uracil1498-N3)-methyltransferase